MSKHLRLDQKWFAHQKYLQHNPLLIGIWSQLLMFDWILTLRNDATTITVSNIARFDSKFACKKTFYVKNPYSQVIISFLI